MIPDGYSYSCAVYNVVMQSEDLVSMYIVVQKFWVT